MTEFSELLRQAVVVKMERGMTVYEASDTYGVNTYVLEQWLLEGEGREGSRSRNGGRS